MKKKIIIVIVVFVIIMIYFVGNIYVDLKIEVFVIVFYNIN